MELKLRKIAKFVDRTFIEGGKKAKEPVLLVSVAAVIQNPWAGKGFVENLKAEIQETIDRLEGKQKQFGYSEKPVTELVVSVGA